MSARTADSQLTFHLPSLSYIDTRWEEPDLRQAKPTVRRRRGGLLAWVSRRIAGFTTWRRNQEAAEQLATMSDRELLDIGLSRGDIARVFEPGFRDELQRRHQSV